MRGFAGWFVGLTFFTTACGLAPAQPSVSSRSQTATSANPTAPQGPVVESPKASSGEPSSDDDRESAQSDPPSPFRLVLEDSYGSSLLHGGHRIWGGQNGYFDLTSRKALAVCSYARGYMMSGKSLYFAARMSPYSACPDMPMLVEHAGDSWVLRRYIDAHDLLIDEWVAGTTIAAVVPYRSGPPWGYELVKIAGGVTPPTPRRWMVKGNSSEEQPSSDEQSCYSELQRPLSLYAFPSGAITVVGEFRCDLESAEEEDRHVPAPARPVIEHFAAGTRQSILVDVPVDEVLATLGPAPDSLWILGAFIDDDPSSARSKQALFHFDGKAIAPIDADLQGALTITLGPPSAERGVRPPLTLPWVLDEKWLRPASGTEDAIRLPQGCGATSAWFHAEHAWVACEEGLYTTDPTVAPFSIPTSPERCEELLPEPEYAVRGIYQRSSEESGCGRSKEHSLPKGSKVSPFPRSPSVEF